MTIENLKLTQVKECLEDIDEPVDYTTAGLLSYCLRNGCLDGEYHLALRMEDLRAAALHMAEKLISEGYGVSDETLRIIDVSAEVTTTETKRLYSNGG